MENLRNDNGDYNEENVNIVHLLRPEHWLQVLRYIVPSDFLSLVRSSSNLRDILKQEMNANLLPLILPILASSQLVITEQSILHYRELNHATKTAIDKMLEDEFSPQRYWETVTSRHEEWTTRHQNLKKICERSGGIQDEEIICRNPFLGRRFEIYSDALNFVHNAEFIEKFFSYMVEHGHNVSQLVCKNLGYIGYLYRLLPLVPNLRVLKLVTSDFVEDQDEYVRPVHYPLLPHLELLDVEGFIKVDYSEKSNIRLNNAFVMNYGCQLKAINCCDDFFQGWWRYSIWYSPRLSNLERVRVTKIGSGSYAFTILSCVSLPNLKEIYLHSSRVFSQCFMKNVLNVMNKCAATLTSVHLYLRMHNEVYLLRNENMSSLPKMSFFATFLSNILCPWFWPFIQNKCENVKDLSFEEYQESYEKSNDTQYILKTLAFTLLPKLKRIRITYWVSDGRDRTRRRIEITRYEVKWREISLDQN